MTKISDVLFHVLSTWQTMQQLQTERHKLELLLLVFLHSIWNILPIKVSQWFLLKLTTKLLERPFSFKFCHQIAQEPFYSQQDQGPRTVWIIRDGLSHYGRPEPSVLSHERPARTRPTSKVWIKHKKVNGLAFTVTTCTITDDAVGQSFDVISDQCPNVVPLNGIQISGQVSEDFGPYQFSYRAFQFNQASDLSTMEITCSIEVCPNGEGLCAGTADPCNPWEGVTVWNNSTQINNNKIIMSNYLSILTSGFSGRWKSTGT